MGSLACFEKEEVEEDGKDDDAALIFIHCLLLFDLWW